MRALSRSIVPSERDFIAARVPMRLRVSAPLNSSGSTRTVRPVQEQAIPGLSLAPICCVDPASNLCGTFSSSGICGPPLLPRLTAGWRSDFRDVAQTTISAASIPGQKAWPASRRLSSSRRFPRRLKACWCYPLPHTVTARPLDLETRDHDIAPGRQTASELLAARCRLT